MISFSALGVRFSIPLLTLIFPILALCLGLGGEIFSLFAALSIHEFAHVLAAMFLGVQLRQIRLTPFGGSARMENPYGVSSGRIIAVAAAGPAANLLLALLLASLTQWQLISPLSAGAHVRHNLVLCLFNLLPALPLDGGRILYALLQGRLGEDRALRVGIHLGTLLAFCLVLAASIGGVRSGKWNLSFLLAAVFIFAARWDERSALNKARAQRLCRLHQEGGLQPLRIYRADAATPVQQALTLLRPGQSTWFALETDDHLHLISSARILAHILKNNAADANLGELIMPARNLQSAAPGIRN